MVFHPQFLKMLQSHKDEMSVLLLLKVTYGPHHHTSLPPGRGEELEVDEPIANGLVNNIMY